MKTKLFVLFLIFSSLQTTAQWQQLGTELTGTVTQQQLGFTTAMGGKGETIITSSVLNDNGEQKGKIEVYRYTNEIWNKLFEQIDIYDNTRNFTNHSRIDISRNERVVAFSKTMNNVDRVSVYREGTNNEFSQLGADIEVTTHNNTDDENRAILTKISLSRDGSVVALSIFFRDFLDNEKLKHIVKIYKYEGETWIQKGETLDDGELFFDTNNNSIPSKFGSDIDISNDGNTIVVGEEQYITDSSFRGRVSTYQFINNEWSLLGDRLFGRSNGNFTTDRFGASVSINGDGTVIGASTSTSGTESDGGYTKIYELNNNEWVQKGRDLKVLGNLSTAVGSQKVKISESGFNVAVYYGGFRTSATNIVGAVAIYNLENGIWTQKNDNIIGENNVANFGAFNLADISSDGTRVTVYDFNDSTIETNSGKAWVLYCDLNDSDETTFIPDNNFEQHLINNNLDDNLDDEVLTANISNLEILNISGIDVRDLTGIEDFTGLKQLYVGNNQNLESIDLSNNLNLEILNVSFTNISELNISQNTNLTEVRSESTRLSSIDISNNFNLKRLILKNNLFTSYELLSTNVLEELDLSNNQLTQLDLFQANELKKLFVNHNNLTNLDFTGFFLEEMRLYNNSLSSLTLANVTSITSFDAKNNPNLTCVQVDNVEFAQNNFTRIDTQTEFRLNCGRDGQTYIPDDGFEQRLINLGFDDILDDYVLTKSIDTITNINLSNASIEDLTGVQDFRELKTLIASNNNLTEFSINTNNAKLDVINVSNNQIAIANFGSIPLKNIDISSNRLITLNLRGNSSLEKINCTANSHLNELVLPITSSLKEIRASFCNLNEIEVPNAVTRLEIDDNNFTIFDARNLRELQYFTCRDNNMQTLLMGNNVDLTNLIARDNDITSLDLSDASLLQELWVNDNALTELDLRNGNLAQLTTFTAIRNPELTCILVDNPAEADDILRNRDEQTDVVTNCDFIGQVYIPDDEFEKRLISSGLDNELDDYVVRENIQNVEELSIFTTNGNPKIEDLTGIEAFTNLKEISFGGNNIANVDFSNNVLLEKINAQFSSVQTITLPENTLLEEIDLWGNQIATIEVSQYTNLKRLVIPANNLSSLDITANVNLEELILSDYDFEVDFTNNTKLKILNLFFMGLTSIDVSMLPELEKLFLENNNLTTINTSNNNKLKELVLSRNEITSVHLSNNNLLERLWVNFNDLSVLDITNNFRITDFDARSNNLTCIKVWDVAFANTNFADKKDDEASFSKDCFTSIPDANFEQALINAGHDEVLDGFVVTSIAATVTSLSLVSKNISDLTGIEAFTSLTNLSLKGNNLTSVDLSQNISLRNLNIIQNNLDRLDISANTSLTIFEAKENPDLNCIQVWDVVFATRNWSDKIDATASFSLDCDAIWTVEVDKDVKSILTKIPGIDEDKDGEVTLKEAKEFVGGLDLSNKKIKNVKGLQAFKNITSLNLSGNNLKDLSALTGKKITLISKTTGKKREVFAKSSKLQTLIVSNNNLETLNLEELKDLQIVDISNNPDLGTVSIKNGNNGAITSFNATNTPNLTCIIVDNAQASNLSTWNIDTATSFVASEAQCRNEVLSTIEFAEDDIKIFPNPVIDFLMISTNFELNTIEIYNAIGKRIVKTRKRKINFSSYSAGVYLVKIVADDNVVIRRIIKN